MTHTWMTGIGRLHVWERNAVQHGMAGQVLLLASDSVYAALQGASDAPDLAGLDDGHQYRGSRLVGHR